MASTLITYIKIYGICVYAYKHIYVYIYIYVFVCIAKLARMYFEAVCVLRRPDVGRLRGTIRLVNMMPVVRQAAKTKQIRGW